MHSQQIRRSFQALPGSFTDLCVRVLLDLIAGLSGIRTLCSRIEKHPSPFAKIVLRAFFDHRLILILVAIGPASVVLLIAFRQK